MPGVFGALGVLGVLLAAKLKESVSHPAKAGILFVKTDFVMGVIAKPNARRSLAVG